MNTNKTPIVASILLSISCSGMDISSESTQGKMVNAITSQEARNALVDMIEQSNDQRLLDTLPDLKSKPVIMLDESSMYIGPFLCNLQKASFSVEFVNGLLEIGYWGRFERKERAWRATVQEKWRARQRPGREEGGEEDEKGKRGRTQ